MKIVPNIVLNLLYNLIHTIYTLYEIIHDCINVLTLILSSSNCSKSDTIQVMNDLRNNSRIPNSISLVVSNEELKQFDSLINKLSRLIHWSSALSIRHISVFDSTGLLIQRRQELLSKISLPFDTFDSNSSKTSNVRITIKNGCIEPYYMLQVPGQVDCSTLRFLSNDDGRTHLIQVARKLCHKSKSINKPIVTLDTMCDTIRTDYNFPDPDLIVRTSSTASICGFCPWQMRLSEIVFLPDHPSLKFNVSKCIIPSNIESRLLFFDFVDTIKQFGSCEQRFGK